MLLCRRRVVFRVRSGSKLLKDSIKFASEAFAMALAAFAPVALVATAKEVGAKRREGCKRLENRGHEAAATEVDHAAGLSGRLWRAVGREGECFMDGRLV